MRHVLGLLALAACASSPRPAAPSNVSTDRSRDPWYCAPRIYTDGPCIPLTHGDAVAIRQAIFDHIDADALERWPAWAVARELAQGPITKDGVGAYFLYVDSVDVLELAAVAKTEGGIEHGFVLRLQRDGNAWVIGEVKPYTRREDGNALDL